MLFVPNALCTLDPIFRMFAKKSWFPDQPFIV